jgi:hypothetical protein
MFGYLKLAKYPIYLLFGQNWFYILIYKSISWIKDAIWIFFLWNDIAQDPTHSMEEAFIIILASWGC